MRMKDVIISVTGVQQGVNGPDAMELVTAGQYGQDEKETLLTWQESELTGLEGTLTTFQIERDRVTLLRVGEVNSQMVFEEGRRHLCVYNTPYFPIELCVDTKEMQNTLTYRGGSFHTVYLVEMNGVLAERAEVTITLLT